MTTYFVTGATGVVGGALLGQLLQNRAARIVCLARGTSAHQVRERIAAIPEVAAMPDAASRLSAVLGDVEAPDLGMEPRDLADVLTRCERVCHCAGVVRMNLPLDDARRAAVGAARNVVGLLREMRTRGHSVKCEYVSTVGVGGRDTRVLPETWLEGARRFHNTYEQAKAEAEDVIREAVAEGHSITLHRPSMVVGNTATGQTRQFQVFYHLVEFLLGRRTHGLFPEFGNARLDLIPCDVVARAIAWSSARDDTAGRVLNLCAGPGGSLPLAQLQHVVQETAVAHGVSIPRAYQVPRWVFRAAAGMLSFVVDASTRRALATLPVFLDYLASEQVFSNDETVALLAGADIEIPTIERYLPGVLDFYFGARQRRS